jgi:hypothetical protein
MSAENKAAMATFRFLEPMHAQICHDLVDDGDAAMDEVRTCFAQLAPTLAYRDNPRHPMAMSVNSCAASLATYLVLRVRGVDVHKFGQAIHAAYAEMSFPSNPLSQELIDTAHESQASAAKGEFVYDVSGSPGDSAFQVNIRSCGICALFAPHDAIELVPYMCALDDLFSDKSGQGLQRTGTIALGRTHCDFHYGTDKPLRLAEQYPERIQLTTKPG